MFLALFETLRLPKYHTYVQATLTRPTTYLANLDLHSWLQRIAFLTGGYEAGTVRFLLRLSRSHEKTGYLLDIGANVGLISIPFALSVASHGEETVRVVSVEAVADNYQALIANVALNALNAAILVVPVALGDVSKMVEVQVEGDLRPGEGTGTGSILPDDSTYECERQSLHLETLDSLLESGRIPRGCSVVKIDTDGYDLKILQGASKLMSLERPVIFGEFSSTCMGWHGQSVADVVDLAVAHDYAVWSKEGSSWTFSSTIPSEGFDRDLLLLPEESTNAFQWCLHR
ncbi:MAG TPA: FkbM family methyltransferase [Thermoanaerobaculia bacterium]|nr:FkbM family methyltransferase [Thermoanaerobaculia bacterium]